MSTVREVLVRTRERIERPDHWCQHVGALAADRRVVRPADPDACRWCLSSALFDDRGADPYGNATIGAGALLARLVPGRDVIRFNDTHTHAEVLALLDFAIAQTEGP
jgi:hypothetical protein